MNKKIFIVQIFIILIFLIIIAISVLFINIFVYNHFNNIKDDLLTDFNTKTGFNLEFDKVSPNVIGSIKIFEVKLYNKEGFKLELGDIEISYSLFALFKKDKNIFSFIKKIKLKTFSLTLDNPNDIEKFKKAFEYIKENFKFEKYNIKKLVIEIPKGNITLIKGKNIFTFEADKLTIILKDEIEISSLLNIYINRKDKEILYSKIKIDGIIKNLNNIPESKIYLELKKTVFDQNDFKIQRFLFESYGYDFTFKRIKDTLPIKFVIKKEKNDLLADINIDNLQVEKLFIQNVKSNTVPDLINLKTKLSYNLKNKLSNGELIFNTYYENYLFLKKFGIDLDLNCKNNFLKINNFIIYNINKRNNINITGSFPLYDDDFKILISFNNFKLPQTILNTKIAVTKQKNIINIISNYFTINSNSIGKFHFQLLSKKDNIQIKTLEKFNGYKINGTIKRKKKKYTANINHNFTNFSLSRIIKAYNKKFDKKLYLNGELKKSFSDNRLTIPDSEFNLKINKNKIVNFNISLNNNFLKISNFKQTNKIGKNIIEIDCWINFSKKPIIALFDIRNDKIKFESVLKFSKKLFYLDINNKQLLVNYNYENDNIHFKANKFFIPVRKYNAEINFDFNYNLKENIIKKNTLVINNLNIFNNKIGTINTLFSYKNNKLIIEKFSYDDELNHIEGQSIHEFNFNNKTKFSGKGFFKDDSKDESYSFDYDIFNKKINAKLFITNMDIKKIAVKKLSGYLNFRINLQGKLNDPDIDIEADIHKGKFGNNNLNAIILLKRTKDEIIVKRANIQFAENRIRLKEFIIKNDIEKKSKKIYTTGLVHVEGLQKILKTNFIVFGRYYPDNPEKELDINIELNNLTVGYYRGLQLVGDEKFDPVQFNITKNKDSLVLKNYGKKFIYLNIDKNNATINLFHKTALILDSQLSFKNKKLDGFAKFRKFPVNAVQKILLPFVGINDGLLEGDISLKGKLNNPEFYGRLNLFQGIVTLPDYLPDPIINITGIIIFDKNKILVRNVNAQEKKGMIHGYGEISFNGWKFERYLFQINSDNVSGHIKTNPVNAKGTGYVNSFVFEGRPKSFNFIGDLLIETADVNFSSFFGINKQKKLQKLPINVFVKFTSGNKVKVNYPIINGIVKPGDVFFIKYVGEEPNIYLGGNISLKKGEVNYLNKRFKIEQANLQFFEDETKVDPNINLKAYYRTKDSKKEPVVIYLTMNSRLKTFDTKFSSFPYKSQEEIKGLLGLSYAFAQNDDIYDNDLNDNPNSNIDTIINTTNYISSTFLFSPLENRIRDITNLDTFSLDTQILGNILKSNTDINKYSNTLDLLDESSLTLGKYIFDELYFESMMSFNKKDELNDQIFLPLDNQNYGFNLQFMLQLELQYLNIGYSFKPRDYNNLLDSDHELSLEMNFKF